MSNQEKKSKEYEELAHICVVFETMPQIIQFSLIGTMIDSYCAQHNLDIDTVISDLREVSKEVEKINGKFHI